MRGADLLIPADSLAPNRDRCGPVRACLRAHAPSVCARARRAFAQVAPSAISYFFSRTHFSRLVQACLTQLRIEPRAPHVAHRIRTARPVIYTALGCPRTAGGRGGQPGARARPPRPRPFALTPRGHARVPHPLNAHHPLPPLPQAPRCPTALLPFASRAPAPRLRPSYTRHVHAAVPGAVHVRACAFVRALSGRSQYASPRASSIGTCRGRPPAARPPRRRPQHGARRRRRRRRARAQGLRARGPRAIPTRKQLRP